MFDIQTLTNMQPITKKPKIPSPELCTADAKWSEANKFFFCFFFLYSHLTPHLPTGMAGVIDYAGGRRARAATYKGAAIPTPRATTTDPDKVLI